MTFPSVQGRNKQASAASDALSYTINYPSGWDTNTAGDRIYAFVSSDSNPTLSTASSGWSKLNQLNSGTQVIGAVFMYTVSADNTTIPDLVVDSTTSQQFSSVSLWVRSSTGTLAHLTLASSSGSTTNSDPALVTNSTGASVDALVIASRHGDTNVGTESPSAAPSGYSNWQSQVSSGSGGAATDTAEKQVTLANSATEDPGTWTSVIEQWVCWTVGIYEAAASGGRPKIWNGSSWVEKPLKVWNGSSWVEKPVKVWNGSSWVLA